MILTMVAQAVERASRCGFMCSVGHILFGLLGLVIAYCTSCYVMNVVAFSIVYLLECPLLQYLQ